MSVRRAPMTTTAALMISIQVSIQRSATCITCMQVTIRIQLRLKLAKTTSYSTNLANSFVVGVFCPAPVFSLFCFVLLALFVCSVFCLFCSLVAVLLPCLVLFCLVLFFVPVCHQQSAAAARAHSDEQQQQTLQHAHGCKAVSASTCYSFYYYFFWFNKLRT